jgi:hypothetical protein
VLHNLDTRAYISGALGKPLRQPRIPQKAPQSAAFAAAAGQTVLFLRRFAQKPYCIVAGSLTPC